MLVWTGSCNQALHNPSSMYSKVCQFTVSIWQALSWSSGVIQDCVGVCMCVGVRWFDTRVIHL